MKRIKYFYNIPINRGSEEKPVWEDCLYLKNFPYSETAEEIAKSEAHNGKYEIYDDGILEPDTATTDDVLNALLGVTV